MKKNNTYQQLVEPHEKREMQDDNGFTLEDRKIAPHIFPSQMKVGAESASWDMIPTWCIANEFSVSPNCREDIDPKRAFGAASSVSFRSTRLDTPMNLSVGWVNIHVKLGGQTLPFTTVKVDRTHHPPLKGKKRMRQNSYIDLMKQLSKTNRERKMYPEHVCEKDSC